MIRVVSTIFMLLWCVACVGVAFALGQVIKDPGSKPVLSGPDLTISGVIWRNKPGTAVIVVANIGTAKSAATTGGYRCKSTPDKNGYAITAGTQFYIPELTPTAKRKITLDCKGSTLLDVVLDGEKKVAEANESNNGMSFAETQKKSGPIKKPGL
jgi:subtilase family serine protease